MAYGSTQGNSGAPMVNFHTIHICQIETVNIEHGCSLKTRISKNRVVMDHSQRLADCIQTMTKSRQHILGIGPTHWMGEGPFRIVDPATRNNYLVVHCSSSDTAYKGVAIVVSIELLPAVTSCDFVSHRIVSVDLKAQLHSENFQRPTLGTVVQVYVPRKDNVKIEHDTFWQQLKLLVNCKLNQGRWVLLMGSTDGMPFDAVGREFLNEYFPGQSSAYCTGRAAPLKVLTWPGYVSSGTGQGALWGVKFHYQSSGACGIETCFSYPITSSMSELIYIKFLAVNVPVWRIMWSKSALKNNQPSAVHASVYAAVSSDQQPNVVVRKLTNSDEIVSHMRRLVLETSDGQCDFYSKPTNIDLPVIQITLEVNPHQCANASDLDWDIPLTVRSPCFSEEAEFYERIRQENGFLLTVERVVYSREIAFYWGGMHVGSAIRHPSIFPFKNFHLPGKFMLSQLESLMLQHPNFPWNPLVFGSKIFILTPGITDDTMREFDFLDEISSKYGLEVTVAPNPPRIAPNGSPVSRKFSQRREQ